MKDGSICLSDYYTINQVASIGGTGRQAVYISIKLKRLKAIKFEGRYLVKKEDFLQFKKDRYSHSVRKDEKGTLIFSAEEGRYSPPMLAKALRIDVQNIYYNIRMNQIPFKKVNKSYVLDMNDLKDFCQKHGYKCLEKKE